MLGHTQSDEVPNTECSPAKLVEIFSPRDDLLRATLNSSPESDDDRFLPVKPFDFLVCRENYELGGLDAGGGYELLLLLASLSLLLPLSEREVNCFDFAVTCLHLTLSHSFSIGAIGSSLDTDQASGCPRL